MAGLPKYRCTEVENGERCRKEFFYSCDDCLQEKESSDLCEDHADKHKEMGHDVELYP